MTAKVTMANWKTELCKCGKRKTNGCGMCRGCRYGDDITERFFRKVEKTDSCWVWTGYLNDGGYGKFCVKGRSEAAHRISYLLFKGTIPETLWVCHTCDNRRCVNPNHLYTGTVVDNVRDMIERKRLVPNIGEKNGRAKLNWNDVESIKTLYSTGKYPIVKLARQYGVSFPTVDRIVKGTGWIKP